MLAWGGVQVFWRRLIGARVGGEADVWKVGEVWGKSVASAPLALLPWAAVSRWAVPL